jgi:hypothetical protein
MYPKSRIFLVLALGLVLAMEAPAIDVSAQGKGTTENWPGGCPGGPPCPSTKKKLKREAREIRKQIDAEQKEGKDVSSAVSEYNLGVRNLEGGNQNAAAHFDRAKEALEKGVEE